MVACNDSRVEQMLCVRSMSWRRLSFICDESFFILSAVFTAMSNAVRRDDNGYTQVDIEVDKIVLECWKISSYLELETFIL